MLLLQDVYKRQAHVYANHTLALDELSEEAASIPAVDVCMEQAHARAEAIHRSVRKVTQIRKHLTDTQFRRVWICLLYTSLSLSGGQKQRVAIAYAIVSNREIIVFDEPTSGLDLKHMREVARSLKSLADQGKTLFVITHDPELVMAGCSYVVHMEKGQIKESYPLDESGSKKVLDFFRIRQ